MMPTGFKFNPTDEELIQILERKVHGEEMPLHSHFIFERNVDELDPQDLEWVDSIDLPNNERYCYYIRENDSREVFDRGWWRATGHIKKIYDINGHIVGHRRPLTFHMFTERERKRSEAIKTRWIMYEYCLESNKTKWRLCKIKYNGKRSTQKDFTSRNDFEETDFVGRQQTLQLDGAYEHFFQPSITSMSMQQCGTVCQEQLQPQALQLENVSYEPSFTHYRQLEAVHEPQQQPLASFHDFSAYYFHDQLEQASDSSGQTFPGLWSWQN